MRQPKKRNPKQTPAAPAVSRLTLKERLKERVLDRYDLQEMLHVSRGTICNLCRKGIISSTKIGGKSFYDAHQIEALLFERKQKQVPANTKKQMKIKGKQGNK